MTECSEPNNEDQPSDILQGLGFYSVVDMGSIGFCGGYLILNANGRPTEFHCTLPVLPQRAQTILYGDSLEGFLYSEHLGPPLIKKAKTATDLVFVNQIESTDLCENISIPVAFLRHSDDGKLQYKAANPDNRDKVKRVVQSLDSIDLLEPFQRIQSAIEEAHAVPR